MADRGDGFQGHVACPLDRPFIVLFGEDGADEAGDGGFVGGGFVGKDADDVGAALDFAVDSSSGLVEWSLVRCSLGKVI